MKNGNQTNIYEQVTNTIVELLETQLESWDKSWVCTDTEGKSAYNAFSKNTYSGLNQLLLSFTTQVKNYAKNAWLTFNQINELGGTVTKGEKSSSVYFWKFLYFKDGQKVDAKKYQNMSFDELKVFGIERKPILRYYRVFNIFQTKGLGDVYYYVEPQPQLPEFEKDQRAELLINSTNAEIQYQQGNKAFYVPISDYIVLPERTQFIGAEPFYSTALHELAHWTGHETRLNRDILNKFGTEEYAFEELIAELTSSFLCAELGFNQTITNNASYIKNWISALKNDKYYIFKTSSRAEKASGFIKAFSKDLMSF